MAYYGYYYPYNNGAVNDMLNQYKGQYQQPTIPQNQPMAQPIIQTPTNEMIWVLSEGEAQSYPVAPNNSVILWDKNSDVVYIKSVNAQNVPSFRVLDYKERTPENVVKAPTERECKCGNKFVSKEDFKALKEEIDTLRDEVDELREEFKPKPKAKVIKKAVMEETDNAE